MKYTFLIVIFVAFNCFAAEQSTSPEEAHLYFTNRVTNNNNAEIVTEYKAETSVHTRVVIDEERYNQNLKERDAKIEELEERVKKLETLTIAILKKIEENEKRQVMTQFMAMRM